MQVGAPSPAYAQTDDLVGIVTSGTSGDVQAAIDKGADVNAVQADSGVTPLIAAAKYNQEAIGVLLKAGADVNAHDTQYSATALMWTAAYASVVDPVIALLDAGADLKAVDKDGNTTLMWAVTKNLNIDIVKALLAAGADANVADSYGATALIAAVKGGSAKIVAALLDAGVNAKVKDSLGNTALTYAKFNSRLKGSVALRRLEAATQ